MLSTNSEKQSDLSGGGGGMGKSKKGPQVYIPSDVWVAHVLISEVNLEGSSSLLVLFGERVPS